MLEECGICYMFLKEDKTAEDLIEEINKYVGNKINNKYEAYLDYEACMFSRTMKNTNIDRESLALKFYKSGVISTKPQEFLKQYDDDFNYAVKRAHSMLFKNMPVKIAVPYKDVKGENYQKIKTTIAELEKHFEKDFIELEFSTTHINLDRESMKNLLELSESVKVEFDTLKFSDNRSSNRGRDVKYHNITLEDVIVAEIKANTFIEELKALNLSPFENYLLIHDFCAKKAYNEDDNSMYDCRNFVDCMNSDQIVCVGYARLMQKLCAKIGIECDYIDREDIITPRTVDKYGNVLIAEGTLGHAFNIVKLKDAKYNIDSSFLCDACWDSGDNIQYRYSAFPIQDVLYDKHNIYLDIKNDKQFIEKYPTKSQIIPFKTFKTALKNAYGAYKKDNVTETEIDKRLKLSVEKAQYSNLAQNCFTREKQQDKCY